MISTSGKSIKKSHPLFCRILNISQGKCDYLNLGRVDILQLSSSSRQWQPQLPQATPGLPEVVWLSMEWPMASRETPQCPQPGVATNAIFSSTFYNNNNWFPRGTIQWATHHRRAIALFAPSIRTYTYKKILTVGFLLLSMVVEIC